MLNRFVAGALAVVVAAPAVAHAQPGPISVDLKLTTIVQASHGGPPTAMQQVIRDEAAYKAFFGGQPPASPRVDFSKEMVLVVGMGTQRSGGFGTTITRAENMLRGITGGHIFVHYVERVPGPGEIVTMALTQPYHMVKCEKSSMPVHFSKDTAPAPAKSFTKLSLETFNPWVQHRKSVKVDANGDVTVTQSTPTGRFAPVNGQATAAELKALRAAFDGADVDSLPARILPVPMDATSFSLVSEVGVKTFTTSGCTPSLHQYTARLRPLLDALLAIENRLLDPAAAQSFKKLTLDIQNASARRGRTIELKADGSMHVDRNGMLDRGQPIDGNATADELKTVKDAFAKADVANLPKSIDPRMLVTIVGGTRVELDSDVGSKRYELTALLDHYKDSTGDYTARVKPLVDAIVAIADRLAAAKERREVIGMVRVDTSGKVTIVENRSSLLEARADTFPALLKVLAGAENKYVRAFGKVEKTAMFGGTVDLEWVEGTLDHATNVRKFPSSRAPIVKVLARGAKIRILDRQGSYFMIELQDGTKAFVVTRNADVGQSTIPTHGIAGGIGSP